MLLLFCLFVVLCIALIRDNNMMCSIHVNAYSSIKAMPLTNNSNMRLLPFRSSSQTRLHDAVSPVANGALPQEYNSRSTAFVDVGYDAQSILDYYDRRPFDVGLRLNMLGLPLLGWYLGLVMDKVLKIEEDEGVKRKRGEELRMHLVRSKSVALIKTGQALSLRPDILKSKIWAEELGKLVDEVDSCPDIDAMNIMREELTDLLPRIKNAKRRMEESNNSKQTTTTRNGKTTRLSRLVETDPILQMFEFDNDCRVVASASIGQVYKARIRPGPVLEAAIGKVEAARWGGKSVAIKIQRPDVAASAALDMYLIRRTAIWLSMFRGGDIVAIADTFGMQLFGELDYVREANNCERFRKLYGKWDDVVVPAACTGITRKKVLVMEWVEGTKGPWMGPEGVDMVRIGLRCSTDQLLRTGLFHSDPHRGNLLRTRKASNDMPGTGQLALGVIDFGMMVRFLPED
jgi:predicted unusual protein kinase regulating ubiquinone biosynthesis (AarF/ABC1/UbiB family)